jgi:hypothetical protein
MSDGPVPVPRLDLEPVGPSPVTLDWWSRGFPCIGRDVFRMPAGYPERSVAMNVIRRGARP